MMILCGNASDSLYLTFKGGCRGELEAYDAYRCTGCGGRFHKDCIIKHFELEKEHDWGRQEERTAIFDQIMDLPIVGIINPKTGIRTDYIESARIQDLRNQP